MMTSVAAPELRRRSSQPLSRTELFF